jgi:hypothetical protein
MDNNTEDTVKEVEASNSKLDIRAALDENFDAADEGVKDVDTKETETSEPTVEEPKQEVVQSTQPERIPLVPPADMNKMEKEAFLNPTPDNAYILQQYMNRRAYETRTDYQRRMQEVEELKKQTSSVYDTIKQYEEDYAKEGIKLSDVARRSIAWDKAMRQNPVETAREWLDSYGVDLNDLIAGNNYQGDEQQQQYQQQQQPGYLTREEAERIAEEKYKQVQTEQEQKAVAYYNQRVVESFVNSKPLFKDPETAAQLEAEMAPIVQALSSTGRYSSPEEILNTAYNYVVAGNPTFSSLNSAMTAKPVLEQKVAAAQKAKAASKSITGSAGSGTPRAQVKDIRDNLRRRMSGD